ncbi:Serine chemoreceptor protein [Leclercia adecarboxylata]|uniref:Serine chemoreceptor protein n=1 Tax=Leclercia adecarboxylata TaxID=83655 RepID=A0A4U9HIS9_9ENTR|nr:Serine chemoreceptor protein [Leclercia adecarboxylata]
MEELTATVKQNAHNAEQAHQVAKTMSDTADRGSEMVCYVIEKMRDISGSADRIADILSVIDGIAFQTNILALNASVEAARAGEQGRGFAVVAGEVRILASRSADAAKEIRTLISDSQSHVSEGSELAQQAGETMDEIASEVMRMTRLMREIANASHEQSRALSRLILRSIRWTKPPSKTRRWSSSLPPRRARWEEQSRELIEAMSSFKLSMQQA